MLQIKLLEPEKYLSVENYPKTSWDLRFGFKTSQKVHKVFSENKNQKTRMK